MYPHEQKLEVTEKIGSQMDTAVLNLSTQLAQGSTHYGGSPEGTERVLNHLERTMNIMNRMSVTPEPVEDES